MNLGHHTPHIYDNNNFLNFILKWTPRTIVAGLAGYYSLGLAYDQGLMASIDRIAIRILRHFMGYVGIGGFMPTFQWYSAWGLRMLAAIGAGLLYDLAERIICASYQIFFRRPREEVILFPTSTKRL
jgi:hypothetical protein